MTTKKFKCISVEESIYNTVRDYSYQMGVSMSRLIGMFLVEKSMEGKITLSDKYQQFIIRSAADSKRKHNQEIAWRISSSKQRLCKFVVCYESCTNEINKTEIFYNNCRLFILAEIEYLKILPNGTLYRVDDWIDTLTNAVNDDERLKIFLGGYAYRIINDNKRDYNVQ